MRPNPFRGFVALCSAALCTSSYSQPTLESTSLRADGWIVDRGGFTAASLLFSEAVDVPSDAIRLQSLQSGDFYSLTVAADPGSPVVSIQTADRIVDDRVALIIDYSITSMSGVALDGEVGNPASPIFPSGDGRPGGRSVIILNVLQGDATRDGVVDNLDLRTVTKSLGRVDPADIRTIHADINSDGVVDKLDLEIVLKSLGGRIILPPEPLEVTDTTPATSAPLSSDLELVTVTYSDAISNFSVDPGSLFAVDLAGNVRAANRAALSTDRTSVVFEFEPPLSRCDQYVLGLSPSVVSRRGAAVTRQPEIVVTGMTPPTQPSIDLHATVTPLTVVPLSGSVDAELIEISGPGGVVVLPVFDGRFSGDVSLKANRLNRLFFTGISDCGTRGVARAVEIVQDQAAPTLFVDLPANGAMIQSASVDVAGRIGDLLSGFEGLTVLVNGVKADVDIGVGTNGTFFLPDLPLELGMPTNITVEAFDVVGNRAAQTISVTRIDIPQDAPRFSVIPEDGDDQIGTVLSDLSDPIRVRVSRPDGSPFASKLVSFTVSRSDGVLSESPGMSGKRRIQVRTDSDGFAEVYWKLGSDAGCGNNRVTVTSTDVAGDIVFCASANPGPSSQINIGSGNNQRGELGALVSERLRAWVSDSCNGIRDIPVTFEVVRGDGLVNDSPSVTVPTGPTGHAEVEFMFGTTTGNNVVRADYAGNPTGPAEFVLFGLERNAEVPTSFVGIVQDNASMPIEGVLAELEINGQIAATAVSDTDGRIVMAGFEGSGSAHLFIDGTDATAAGGKPVAPLTFPTLEFELSVIANAENGLGTPVLLPRYNPDNFRSYSTTEQTILEVVGVDGLHMIIEPGSMTLADGTPAQDGELLALNQVHHDDIPMPMPDGVAPPFAWTIYPPSASFDPPIRVEYPNMSGLAPGSIAYFLQFDHETSEFEIVTSGSVSEDGSTVVSDPGGGISISGWGCNCPPYAVTGECKKCEPEQNGCGSAAPLLDLLPDLDTLWVPDNWLVGFPPVRVNVTEACNRHDICYQTCGTTQASCDNVFFDNMILSCSAQCRAGGSLGVACDLDCAALSWIYFRAVVLFGSSSYVSAQQDLIDNECCTDAIAVDTDADARGILPPIVDFDEDLLPDDWEYSVGLDPTNRNDALLDHDADGLIAIFEFVAKTDPFIVDSDMNGSSDYDDFVNMQTPPRNTINSSWGFAVGSQNNMSSDFGRFILPNVSSSDEFGMGGPGSAPDFLSDEFLRVTGSGDIDGNRYYAFSEPFQIAQGEAFELGPLVITATPPPLPDFVIVSPADGQPLSTVLNEIGQTVQLETMALLNDGSIQDVTNRTEWTVYRTSNPTVVTVGPNGLVTAVGPGEAFVTASNEGATSTLRVRVDPGDPLTTVEGFVFFEDGTPAPGASVEVIGQGAAATTNAGGFFSIAGVATTLGPISVRAELSDLSDLLGPLDPVGAGITDAGIASLTLPTNTGRQFLAIFQRNFDNVDVSPALFLSSDEPTIGEVLIAGLGFSETFAVSPGVITRVDLPASVLVDGSDVVRDLAVIIEADRDLTAYALNQKQLTTDAYVVLPVESLGMSYRAMCSADVGGANNRSQFAITAAEDDTLVTISPSATTTGRVAGQPYTIILNRGEVYQLRSDGGGEDLTGSAIVSSKPVAVVSGNSCGQVPLGTDFCDHICEQMVPVNAWGSSAITVPLATRLNGDSIRVLARDDQTSLMINRQDGSSQVLLLNAGQFAEGIFEGITRFVADKPILVAQYSLGSQADGVASDPFMTIVPPAEQFLDSYTFATPQGFASHFVNLIAETTTVVAGGVILDGAAIDPSAFTPVSGTGFAAAIVPISEGTHGLSGTSAIGVTVYGFANDDSYGYPGGIALGNQMANISAPIGNGARLWPPQHAGNRDTDMLMLVWNHRTVMPFVGMGTTERIDVTNQPIQAEGATDIQHIGMP